MTFMYAFSRYVLAPALGSLIRCWSHGTESKEAAMGCVGAGREFVNRVCGPDPIRWLPRERVGTVSTVVKTGCEARGTAEQGEGPGNSWDS